MAMAASITSLSSGSIAPRKIFRATTVSGRPLRVKVSVPVLHRRKTLTISAVATNQTAVSGAATRLALEVGIDKTVLLQGFYWNANKVPGGWWNFVSSRIDQFKDAGFTHIWLPPPSDSVAPEGYMPGDWYNLNSKYGTPEQLKSLTAALIQNNIVPVADIVVNHRTGGLQDSDGKYTVFLDRFPHKGASIAWNRGQITGDDDYGRGFGNRDTGDAFIGAPDLDHTNVDVQNGVIAWLSWLISDIGFGGFRFDMVKGFAPNFIEQYVRATASPSVFNVGEYYDGDRQKVVNYIDGTKATTSAFDFPMKYILQDAIKENNYSKLADAQGKPSGALGYWPQRSVPFLENHDTEKARGGRESFPDNHVMTGYAYILTHPCTPTVFWPHYFDWGLGQAINILLALRKRNGISASSKVRITTAEPDLYMANIDDKVIVKLGPRWDLGNLKPDPNQGWRLAASGTDYAVYDKTAPMFLNVPGTNMLPLM